MLENILFEFKLLVGPESAGGGVESAGGVGGVGATGAVESVEDGVELSVGAGGVVSVEDVVCGELVESVEDGVLVVETSAGVVDAEESGTIELIVVLTKLFIVSIRFGVFCAPEVEVA